MAKIKTNIISRLINKIDSLDSPIVAGIDTTIEMIPYNMQSEYFGLYGKTPYAVSEMLLAYNKSIIDNIYDLVPAVKIQIAMYEAYGIHGLDIYNKTAEYAKSRGLIVIGDIKRGDIGSTASAYSSHLTGVEIEDKMFYTWTEDIITINPYLGRDSLVPFTEACNKSGKACFVLVKTSNPGSSDIQDLISMEHGKPIYEIVGKMVSDLGKDSTDDTGYGNVGAVVGAAHREIGAKLREQMPHTFFLVPGYGAQGAEAEDLKGFFDNNGRGAIINSSRGIIANWKENPKFNENTIGEAARFAVIEMKDDIGKMMGK